MGSGASKPTKTSPTVISPAWAQQTSLCCVTTPDLTKLEILIRRNQHSTQSCRTAQQEQCNSPTVDASRQTASRRPDERCTLVEFNESSGAQRFVPLQSHCLMGYNNTDVVRNPFHNALRSFTEDTARMATSGRECCRGRVAFVPQVTFLSEVPHAWVAPPTTPSTPLRTWLSHREQLAKPRSTTETARQQLMSPSLWGNK